MLLDVIVRFTEQTANYTGTPKMSTRTYDEPADDRGPNAHDCILLDLEDGQVILYDPAETGAWIQSDVHVALPRPTEAHSPG